MAEIIVLCPRLKHIAFGGRLETGYEYLFASLERYHPGSAIDLRNISITLDLFEDTSEVQLVAARPERHRFGWMLFDCFESLPWYLSEPTGLVQCLIALNKSDVLQPLASVVTFGPSLLRALKEEQTSRRQREGWTLVQALSRRAEASGKGRWVFPSGVADQLSGVLEVEMVQEDLLTLARRWYYARI